MDAVYVNGFSSTPLRVRSVFRRHGVEYEVVDVDVPNHLVRCTSMIEYRTFYVRSGFHPLYDNLRVNEIDILFQPDQDVEEEIFLSSFMDRMYYINRYIQDENVTVIRRPELVRSNVEPQDIERSNFHELNRLIIELYGQVPVPMLVNFITPRDRRGSEDTVSVPSLVSVIDDDIDTDDDIDMPLLEGEVNPVKVGRKFYVITDVTRSYVIVSSRGWPVHTIKCSELERAAIHYFKLLENGREDATPLCVDEMVDLEWKLK